MYNSCFFEVYFVWKYIKIYIFYILEIIFNINASKWYKNIKKYIFQTKKN
jgi:hypothetical protein